MRTIKKIISLEHYRLQVEFEGRPVKTCDISCFLDKGDFMELRDVELFNRVKNTGFSAEWPNELDLSSDALFHIGM